MVAESKVELMRDPYVIAGALCGILRTQFDGASVCLKETDERGYFELVFKFQNCIFKTTLDKSELRKAEDIKPVYHALIATFIDSLDGGPNPF